MDLRNFLLRTNKAIALVIYIHAKDERHNWNNHFRFHISITVRYYTIAEKFSKYKSPTFLNPNVNKTKKIKQE